MSLELDEHRHFLKDQHRIDAFRRAIAEVVRPGDVVVDLASGTGILGLLACEAGAGRVYSIDAGGIIQIARAVSVANGFGDRQTFLKGMSLHVDLPERADVVVADQIGRFGFEAGVVEYFADARRRFLKPGGVLLPSRIDLLVAPVEAPGMFDQIQFWAGEPAGFDFSPARSWAVSTGYPTRLSPDQLLGAAARAVSMDLREAAGDAVALETEVAASRAGTMHGVGGWFEAQLSPGVTLTNSPFSSARIDRRHVFFPLDHPVPLDAGDAVRIGMRIRPVDTIVAWTVEVWSTTSSGERVRKSRQRRSTLAGLLLSTEDLERTRPQHVPTLSRRGAARRTLLNLCDGTRSIAEIEQALHERHPDQFATAKAAGPFVAEVMTGYST